MQLCVSSVSPLVLSVLFGAILGKKNDQDADMHRNDHSTGLKWQQTEFIPVTKSYL